MGEYILGSQEMFAANSPELKKQVCSDQPEGSRASEGSLHGPLAGQWFACNKHVLGGLQEAPGTAKTPQALAPGVV